MTKLYIVRHGQTVWNLEQRIQGHADSQLTELGRSQARQRREDFKNINFDAIYTSDLSRAKETANILTEGRSIQLTHAKQLRERNQGALEGYHRERARAEFSDMYELLDKSDEKARMDIKIVPDSESPREAVDRFLGHIKDIIHKHPDQTVLIVTHGGVMHHFLIEIGLGLHGQITGIDNLAYIVVESNGRDFKLLESRGVIGLDNQALDKFPKKG